MYHSLSIQPTKELLGYFQILPILNKTAIKIHMQVFCGHKFSTHLDKYQRASLKDHMEGICLAL